MIFNIKTVLSKENFYKVFHLFSYYYLTKNKMNFLKDHQLKNRTFIGHHKRVKYQIRQLDQTIYDPFDI